MKSLTSPALKLGDHGVHALVTHLERVLDDERVDLAVLDHLIGHWIEIESDKFDLARLSRLLEGLIGALQHQLIEGEGAFHVGLGDEEVFHGLARVVERQPRDRLLLQHLQPEFRRLRLKALAPCLAIVVGRRVIERNDLAALWKQRRHIVAGLLRRP